MSRDYAVEMRAVIDAEAHGTYAPPVVAQQIVEKLRATDPDLLAGWLDVQAVQIIRHAINLRDCSTRSHNRVTASRSVFREAAEAADVGDVGPLSAFLTEVYKVEDGTKMPLRDMRAPDLRFAAADFERRAAENAMQQAFLEALAKKVRNRTVGDVFTEERLSELWRSLG